MPTLMVAREGSGQSLLMYTNALWLLAHTAPLSKFCPAVRLAAVSLASGGPATATRLLTVRCKACQRAVYVQQLLNQAAGRQGRSTTLYTLPHVVEEYPPSLNTDWQTPLLPSWASAQVGSWMLLRPTSLSLLLMHAS